MLKSEKNKMNVVTTMSSVLLVSALVYGCGGSGGGGSTPSPDGIYSGSITGGQVGLYNGNEKAVVHDSRFMVFSTANGIQQVFDGDLVVSEDSLSGQMNLFDNGIPVVKALLNVDGTFSTNVSAQISFSDSSTTSLTPVPDGEISLTEDVPLYEKGSDAATINHTWSANHGGVVVTTTMTIDSQGGVTGSDTEGCVISGTIVGLSADINVYGVNLVYQNCVTYTGIDGTYTGLGWTEGATDEFFNVVYANDTFGRAIVLQRQ